jgi:hypothetical protein
MIFMISSFESGGASTMSDQKQKFPKKQYQLVDKDCQLIFVLLKSAPPLGFTLRVCLILCRAETLRENCLGQASHRLPLLFAWFYPMSARQLASFSAGIGWAMK